MQNQLAKRQIDALKERVSIEELKQSIVNICFNIVNNPEQLQSRKMQEAMLHLEILYDFCLAVKNERA